MDNPIADYAIKHYTDEESGLCTLCANSGFIHTQGLTDAKRRMIGRTNFCICPNGQAHRQQSNGNAYLSWRAFYRVGKGEG